MRYLASIVLSSALTLLAVNPLFALEVLEIDRQVTTRGTAPELLLYPGKGLNISFLDTDETVFKIWFDDPSWASLDVEGSLESDNLRGAKIIHLKRTQDLRYENNITTDSTTLTLVTNKAIHRFIVTKATGYPQYDTIAITQTDVAPQDKPQGEDNLAAIGGPYAVDIPVPPPNDPPAALTDEQPEADIEAQLRARIAQLEADRAAQRQARREQRLQQRRERIAARKRRRQLKRAELKRERAAKRQAKLQAQIAALENKLMENPPATAEVTQQSPAVVVEIPSDEERGNPAFAQASALAVQTADSKDWSDLSTNELARALIKGANIARTLPQPEIEFSRKWNSNWSKVQRIARRLRRGSTLDAAIAAERIDQGYVLDLIAYAINP